MHLDTLFTVFFRQFKVRLGSIWIYLFLGTELDKAPPGGAFFLLLLSVLTLRQSTHLKILFVKWAVFRHHACIIIAGRFLETGKTCNEALFVPWPVIRRPFFCRDSLQYLIGNLLLLRGWLWL